MISTKRKKIKKVILFFLIVIVLILLGFTLYYSGYIEVGKNLIKGEKTKKDIIDEIIINDISLNYDSLTNTYYLPIILEENKETKLDIQLQSSYNLSSKIDGREFKKEIEISEIIDYEKTYELDVENFLYKEKYYIKFTNIPSISLNFDEENASFEYIYSEFLITDPNYKENNTKYQYSDDSEIRYRGSSTGGYPKKGYRIKLEKEPNFGMLGMTKSRKWILDGLVTDSSCLRTKVSSEIWNKMNEDLPKEKHLDLKSEFVEVYINDKYVGLYLLKEAINEELLNLEEDGVLIKGIDWNTIDFNNYSNIESEAFGPFEIKYPENKKQYPEAWKNILDKMKIYYSGDISFEALNKTFYVDNAVNHKIFLLITQALDNYEYKNIYYSIKNDEEDTKVLITPWDVDLTFGMLWNGDKEAYTEQYDRVGEIVEGYAIPIDTETKESYKRRWNILTKEALSKEEINKLIDEQFEFLNKANSLERENKRNEIIEIKRKVNAEQERQELKDWYSKRFDVINNYINSL